MKDYDAYLFDWDGTLARTLEIWLEEIYKKFHEHDLKITPEENARHFGNLNSPLLYGLPEDKLQTFIQMTNVAAQARLPGCLLYDNAHELLHSLKKQGKRLALVTTANRKSLDITITPHAVEKLFDVVITAEDVKTHKPDPEGILLAISQLGLDKSRALMLGDSNKDLEAAKNAGIDSLLFYPDAHKMIYSAQELQIHQPKFVINSWQEMLDQLELKV